MSSKPSTSAVDFSNTLCLACSSSLPPYKSSQILFTTNCCSRPICPACLSSNARLARYDPCLACLGGVGALSTGAKGKRVSSQNINVDGAVRDEDTFVLGEDEDEEEGAEQNESSDLRGPPPPYSSELPVVGSGPSTSTSALEVTPTGDEPGTSTDISAPSKYYIQPNDNLRGIALRFGVNVRPIFHL